MDAQPGQQTPEAQAQPRQLVRTLMSGRRTKRSLAFTSYCTSLSHAVLSDRLISDPGSTCSGLHVHAVSWMDGWRDRRVSQ